jgi:two-component system nitrate/nitrite response regulator NarL
VLLSEGIVSLLQASRYKVVAIAAEPSELPPNCRRREQPTLAMVGTDRQDGNLDKAAESIRVLRSLMPEGKVVLVVETDGPIDLRLVVAISPNACIFNLGSRDVLIKILELVFADQRVLVFDKSIATAAASENVDYRPAPSGQGQGRLSSREYEILTYLAQGKSNKLIARVCHISEATVKVHLKAILRKTNTHNRTQAAIWAIEHGLRNLDHNGGMVGDAPGLSPDGTPPKMERA